MREKYIFVILLLYQGISCDLNNSNTANVPCNGPSCVHPSYSKPPCEDEILVAFLADIQVINPESIVEWAVDNLEPLCRKICVNLKKIDNYLESCTPPDEDDLYMSLIAGVKTLREKLCTESEFIKKYSVYYSCLHELRNDFEGCNGPADWNEDPDKNEMCKNYKKVLDCYYIKAAKVCGYDAAATIKELMKDVVNSVIRIKCSGIGQNPYVSDPMPETYIKRSEAGSIMHISSKICQNLNIRFATTKKDDERVQRKRQRDKQKAISCGPATAYLSNFHSMPPLTDLSLSQK